MKPTLLILAAGLGTRYGGLKQIDPVGPGGEILIDYPIYDAARAGFGKLVFVIRCYFEDAFRGKIGDRFDGLTETAYAYQEMDACLGSLTSCDVEIILPHGRGVICERNVKADGFFVPHEQVVSG